VSVALLLVPDFLLIAGGALLRRLPGFALPVWAGIERLVYFVLFPALLFRSLAATPLRFADAVPLLAAGLGFALAGMALSALAQPLFRLPRDTFAACFQCGFRFNTYIILAAVGRIAGAEGLALASLLIGVLVPTVNVAAVAMLAHGRETHLGRELARNPLVLACLAGIAWNALAWPLPALPGRVLELLGSAAVPLGLLAVGAGLRITRGTLPLPALAWFHFVKLAAMPAIAWALAHGLGLAPLETRVAIAVAAVPTATSAYILATQMGGAGAPVALIVSTGTLLAAVTLPLWLAFAT
jgi:predicted permease